MHISLYFLDILGERGGSRAVVLILDQALENGEIFWTFVHPSILPSIRLSFHPSPFRAILPSSSLWADWLGLQTLLAGPQVWLAGPQVWLAGCQALLAGPQAWLTGPQAMLDSLEGGGLTNR